MPVRARKHGADRADQRERDRQRGSAAARGYDARWRRYRVWFLARRPLCEMDCKVAGRTTASTVVDHIIPHRGDQKLFWDPGNHQAGCETCHNRKTARGE